MLKFCQQLEQLSEYLLVNNSQNLFSHYTQSIDHMKVLICAHLKVLYVSLLAKICQLCSAKYCFASISVTSVQIWFLAIATLLRFLMLD